MHLLEVSLIREVVNQRIYSKQFFFVHNINNKNTICIYCIWITPYHQLKESYVYIMDGLCVCTVGNVIINSKNRMFIYVYDGWSMWQNRNMNDLGKISVKSWCKGKYTNLCEQEPSQMFSHFYESMMILWYFKTIRLQKFMITKCFNTTHLKKFMLAK